MTCGEATAKLYNFTIDNLKLVVKTFIQQKCGKFH